MSMADIETRAVPEGWLKPTPTDDGGAPLRVPTRFTAAELAAVTSAPIVGAVHEIDEVEVVETTFIYSEPRDLDVMVHLNGLTDAHRTDIRPALLERINDSNWYALTYLLPADGVWSYRFVARENIPHDVGSERSGWSGIHREGRPDPLNTEQLADITYAPASVHRGPQAPRRSEYTGLSTGRPPVARASEPRAIRFWQHTEVLDGSGLSLHFSPSGTPGAPLLVLFDAEQHLLLPTLDALTVYPHALDVVALDSGTGGQRSEVLPNPERTAARVSAMFAVLATQFARRYDSDDVIVSGASFGGLAAAGLVVHHPELARRAIAQSASYWYDPGREPSHEDIPGALTRCVREHGNLPNRQIIVQVGTDEGSMGIQAQMFVAAAEAACIDVRARQYRGGHDWAWWSHALLDGLDEILTPETS